jgi:hypothetical protein
VSNKPLRKVTWWTEISKPERAIVAVAVPLILLEFLWEAVRDWLWLPINDGQRWIEGVSYFLVVISVPLIFRGLILARRSNHRQKIGQCPQCGYDLRATPTQCPECGKMIEKVNE